MRDLSKRTFGRFAVLSGDVNFTDYGGTFYRLASARRYHVIEILNWEETCGDDAPAATWNVSLSEVDLDAIPEREKASAMRSCGIASDGLDESGEPLPELAFVDALYSSGCRAPLWQDDGNNWHNLIREAVRESSRLDDPRAHRAAMARPVNKIGSTAAEFMAGDITSGMVRGIASGSADALIMGKMYQSAGYQTLGGKLDIEDVIAIESALPPRN